MKALTIVVPSYNSEEYLGQCLDSLIVGGEDIEVIVVNDGSIDNTATIATNYKEKFPTIVKVIHQENGGHGMAVNTGVCHATGAYVKIVDSDDWVEETALHTMIELIRELIQATEKVDMIISNYVYEKEGARHKKSISYSSFLPKNRIFSWDEFRLPMGKYLLMHSLIYRTELLQKSKLTLPKHTFYVDNLFAFEPLLYVENMYYLDVDFYRYFIGRENQSVNEKNMIAQIDQQLLVNKRMVDYYAQISDDNLKRQQYMRQYLEIITTVSSVMLIKDGTPENLKKKESLWQYIAVKDASLYHALRKRLMGYSINLPGRAGRYTIIGAYRLLRKIYGFN